jgi:hypothetical protein
LLLLLLCERALAFILLQREIAAAAAAAALTELVSKFCCAIAPRWARIFYLIGFGVSPCVARGVGRSASERAWLPCFFPLILCFAGCIVAVFEKSFRIAEVLD